MPSVAAASSCLHMSPAGCLPSSVPCPSLSACVQVLSRLLPIVIGKLGPAASPLVQKKVLEILSHVNKRTRALPTLRLPLRELAVLYAGVVVGVGEVQWGVRVSEVHAERQKASNMFPVTSATLP